MPDHTSGLTSVVVVAADSGPLLQRCIDSVLASRAVEVLLVDNASRDGEVERLQTRHGADARVRIIRNAQNLGFGPACNRGAASARGDVLVFLNPDAEVEPETVSALRALLASDARIGMLGVEVCDPGGTPARGNRRRDPTVRRALATLSGLARLESRWPRLEGVEVRAPAVGRERAQGDLERVEAVSGACMAVPATVFAVVGGFDEGYFLHAEDLDLCRRIRDAGFDVAIAAGLRIVHAQGSSSRERPLFVSRHKHRGMWRYFLKFDPAARNPLIRGLVWMGLWMHFGLVAVMHGAGRIVPAKRRQSAG